MPNTRPGTETALDPLKPYIETCDYYVTSAPIGTKKSVYVAHEVPHLLRPTAKYSDNFENGDLPVPTADYRVRL